MKNIILFGCICLALISCTSQRYIYNPSPFYNPILTGKGQSNITALYSWGSADNAIATKHSAYNYGYDGQGAYALSKHFALTASVNYKRERDNYYFDMYSNGTHTIDSSIVNYQRQNWQIGAGYSLPFNRNKSSFSVFGFFGLGKNKLNDAGLDHNREYANYLNSNSLIYSIQPAINFGLNNRVTSSIITRFTYVNNRNIKTNYTDVDLPSKGLSNINGLFYEAIGYSLKTSPVKKWSWFRLDCQVLYSTSGETENIIHYARGSSVSLGLSIDPFKLLKK
jgi:hypothetical protein